MKRRANDDKGPVPLTRLGPGGIAGLMAERREPAFRAKQVADWVYKRFARSFDEMTNLPAALRADLAREFRVHGVRVAARAVDPDGTAKLALQLADGEVVECVAIPEPSRLTACLSTQAGCGTRCVFCASGLGGLVRNLEPGEIVDQYLEIGAEVGGPTHVVFMGVGEPLANYANFMEAVRTLNDPAAAGLGARRMTVSTAGPPERIRRLAGEGIQVNLAVSLHAPTDELRARLVPGAKGVRVSELVAAARYYTETTGRRVTFEYVAVKGLNTSSALAKGLAVLLGHMRHHLNVIPLNPVKGLPYERPEEGELEAFAGELRRAGVHFTLREPRGSSIGAACGQLRHEHRSAKGQARG